MKTAAIYARYSPGRDRDQTSTIEAQISMCKEKAAQDGVTVNERHIYIDRNISGATVQRRSFQKMVSAIKRGDFPDILYAKDDKRLFRNEREAGELIEWIWEHDVEIRYCLVQFGDPRSSDEQWFLQRQFHLFAELERRRKAKEVFQHQRQNALSGYSNGGLPPYGYQRKEIQIIDDNGVSKKKLTWELHPTESEAVKIAFDLHQSGLGIKLIAEALTQRGYRSRRGAPMNKATIGEWFRNPYPFAGCVVWNTRDHKLKDKPRSEWIIAQDAYPKIIDFETADSIYKRAEQRKIGKKGRIRGENMGRRKYLLTGLLKCAECGANFVSHTDKKKNQAYYICGTRTRRRGGCDNGLYLDHQRIEDQLTQQILDSILQPGFIEAYFMRVLEAQNRQLSDINTKEREYKRQLAQIQSRLKEFLTMLADKQLPKDELLDLIHTEQARKQQIEAQLDELKKRQPKLPGPDDIAIFRDKLKTAIEGDEAIKKAAFHSLIKEIKVHKNAALQIEFVVKLANKPNSATTLPLQCQYHPAKRPKHTTVPHPAQ